MSKKSDARMVFDEEKPARFVRFLRRNASSVTPLDALLLHYFLKRLV